MSGVADWQAKISIDIEDLKKRVKVAEGELDKITKEDRKIKLDLDTKTLESAIQKLDKMLDSLGKGTGDFKQLESLSKELSSITTEVQSLSKAFGKVDDSGAKTLLSSIQNIDRSLSELSQNILNVNKNMSNMGGNTSGAVRQVENIGNAAADAVKQVDKLADAQSKLGEKINTSSGLDSSISKYEEIVSLVKEYYELTSKIKQPTLKRQSRSEDYDKIDGYLLKKAPQKVGTTDIEKDINDRYHKMAKGVNEGSEFAIKAMKSAIQRYWSDVTEMPSDEKLLSSRKVVPYGNKGQKEEYIIPKKYQDLEKSVIQETIAMNQNNAAYEEEQKQIKANNAAIEERLNLIRQSIKQNDKNSDYKGEYKMGLSLKASDRNKKDIFGMTSDLSQEEMLKEICNMLGVEIPQNAEKAKHAIKKVSSAQAETNISSGNSVGKVETKLDDAVISAKELDKALDGVNVPTDTFDSVLSKLDKTKSELIDIVKITKSWVSDSEGKGHEAYTLKDSRGSTEIYGVSSKTDKGQILRSNIVQYDKSKDNVDNKKAELEVEKQLAKEYENSTKAQQKKWEASQKEQANYESEQKKADALAKQNAAYNELMNTIKQYSEVAKRVAGGNAEDGDIDKMSKLEDKISKLQKQPILSSSQVEKSEKSLVSLYDQLDKIERKLVETNQKAQDKQLAGFDKRISGYDTKLINYQATSKKFESGGWTSDTYKEQIDQLNKSIKEYKTLLASMQHDSGLVTDESIKQLNEYESKIKEVISTVSNMSATEKGFTKLDGQKTMNWISQQLRENSKMSRQAKNQIKAYYAQIESNNPTMSLAKIRAEVLKIVNAEEQAGRAGKSMFDAIKEKAWYGVASAIGTYFGFNDILRYGREAINTIVELDDALVDLKKTTSMSGSELENFYYDANDVAKQMGVTTAEIINQASAWSRLGFSSAEASTQMSKLSAQFAAISPGMDIDTATDGLVSTMKAFDIDVSDVQREVMDNINKIGNTAATSNDEIVDMLTRSSAAMSAANNTLEETIALETAAVEITRSAETTGTAFKTLSMRLRGYDEQTESYSNDVEQLSGDIADLTKTASTPGGISLFTDDTKQTYKSTYELLKEISQIYDQLSDKTQAQLLEKLAGKRGGQVVAGLLSNFSAAEKAMQDMDDAAGSSNDEMSIIEQSLTYKINALKETWVGAVQDMADRGAVGDIIEFLTNLSNGLIGIVDILDKISSLGGNISSLCGDLGTIIGLVTGITGHGKMYCAPCYKILLNVA